MVSLQSIHDQTDVTLDSAAPLVATICLHTFEKTVHVPIQEGCKLLRNILYAIGHRATFSNKCVHVLI